MVPTTSIRATAGAVVAAALIAVAPATASPFTAGSDGLGDPFFPQAGNGGYDVRHYSLDLDYQPPRREPARRARRSSSPRPSRTSSSFNLDLRGFTISERRGQRAATPPSRAAACTSSRITPRRGLRSGWPFRQGRYAGTPTRVIDPDGSSEGWVPTSDGAFVVNEPQGSPGWYPSNDNPRDKATYDYAITVPEGKTAIGNGRLLSKRTADGKRLALARGLADGALPDDGHERRLQPHRQPLARPAALPGRRPGASDAATHAATWRARRRCSSSSTTSTAAIRSAPAAESWTTVASATRSSRRPSRCTTAASPSARWSTR